MAAAFADVTADDAFRRLVRGYHAVFRYTAENLSLQSLTVYGPVIPARSGFASPPRAREEPVTPGPNAEQQTEALRRLADANDPAARDAAVDILARATQPELIEEALNLTTSNPCPRRLFWHRGGQRPPPYARTLSGARPPLARIRVSPRPFAPAPAPTRRRAESLALVRPRLSGVAAMHEGAS